MSEKLLKEIFHEEYDSLENALPCGYFDGRGKNDQVDALLKEPVIEVYSSYGKFFNGPWPRNWDCSIPITKWYQLKNGKQIVWVEDKWKWEFMVK